MSEVITETAEVKHCYRIGGQPAIYKKGEDWFFAWAMSDANKLHEIIIRLERGKYVGEYSIDHDVKLLLAGSTIRRVMKCLSAASNAYISENRHANENHKKNRAKKRAEAEEREAVKEAENAFI